MSRVITAKGSLSQFYNSTGFYRAEYEIVNTLYKIWKETAGLRLEIWAKADGALARIPNSKLAKTHKDLEAYFPPHIYQSDDWTLVGYFPY